MRITGLIIAAAVTVMFCGCDGEMWISTGDDGWTSDPSQPWPPKKPAASAGGSVTDGGKKKNTTSKTPSNTSKKSELGLVISLPETVQPEKSFSCSLSVTNSTDKELKNVMVEGVVPAGLKVTDASGQVSMRWRIPSLAAGASKSLTATMIAGAEGSYTLQASATAEGGKLATVSTTIKIVKEEKPVNSQK